VLAKRCADMDNYFYMKAEGDKTQIFTTILAYSLPILQFFFGQLTGTVQNLFLFKNYFFVVSIFTAITSYVMITILKARPWFEIIPFQFIKKRNARNWATYTNASVYANDDIISYQSKHKPPKPLNSIRPDNVIQVVFLPCLLIGFVAFLVLGLQYGSKSSFTIQNSYDVFKTVLQAIAYAMFIVFTVLSFAHQYIRDAGAKAFKEKNSSKFEKAILLARKRDSFKELKSISLISQKDAEPGDPNSYIAFSVAVENTFYVLVTDNDCEVIILAKEFENLSAAEQYVWGPNNQ
jgi:hypothetical protein